MAQSPDLADRPLGEVIDAIASSSVAPGAGAAGAVGLALAAACAAKAAAITLKHRPDDAALAKTRAELSDIARRALRGAEEDAAHFATFMREQDASSAEDLLQVGAGLSRAARALRDLVADLAERVEPSVLADVKAAHALCEAFADIQTETLQENREAAGRIEGEA